MTRDVSRAIRASLLACCLVSCSRQSQPADSAAPASPERPLERIQVAPPSTEFAQLTLDVMSALGRPVTLADWRAQHSTDVVEVFKPTLSEWPNEKWCARAVSVHLVDSDSKATRTVYFYTPSPPQRPTIPAEDRALLDQCRSGLVSTTVDLPDSTRAARLVEQVRQQINAAIGVGQIWFNRLARRNPALAS